MLNEWKPSIENNEKPLYIALADALESDISSGRLKPGEKLPPQRELADQLKVNLSTITRAFRLCELKGLISGVVGRGTFVSADAKVSLSMSSQDNFLNMIEMGQVLPLHCIDKDTGSMVKALLQDMDMEMLIRYSAPAGHCYHRMIGSEWLKKFNIDASADQILVTPGSQNALSICLLALFSPGDRIAVDSATYPGIKSLAALHGIRLVPIEMDEDGMIPQSLVNACKSEEIKGVYLMPEFQNPTTRSLMPGSREEIAAAVKKYDLALLEDDVYSFTGDRGSIPISALVPGQGVYIGGTAKLLGAGFRVSYVKAPDKYRTAMEKGILNTTWMASPITAELVSRLIESGKEEMILKRKREEAQRRNALANKILAGYDTAGRSCGFFQWLSLPGNWRGREFELALRESGVQVFCAEKFAVGSSPSPSAVRISLSGPDTMEELEKGLNAIKTLLQKGCDDQGIIL
jgi:DNA-binding transcriptional MocR family regulator